jgi:hypothetical protein
MSEEKRCCRSACFMNRKQRFGHRGDSSGALDEPRDPP